MADNPKLNALISLVAIYTTTEIAIGIGTFTLFFDKDYETVFSKQLLFILGNMIFVPLLIVCIKHIFDIYDELNKFDKI